MKTRFHVPSKRVPAKAWWEIKRWDPARTRHTISGLARSLRIGSVAKNLLLKIVLFAAVPAGSRLGLRERNASTVHVRCRRRSGMLLLAPISRGRCRSRENLFDGKR